MDVFFKYLLYFITVLVLPYNVYFQYKEVLYLGHLVFLEKNVESTLEQTYNTNFTSSGEVSFWLFLFSPLRLWIFLKLCKTWTFFSSPLLSIVLTICAMMTVPTSIHYNCLRGVWSSYKLNWILGWSLICIGFCVVTYIILKKESKYVGFFRMFGIK